MTCSTGSDYCFYRFLFLFLLCSHSFLATNLFCLSKLSELGFEFGCIDCFGFGTMIETEHGSEQLAKHLLHYYFLATTQSSEPSCLTENYATTTINFEL